MFKKKYRYSKYINGFELKRVFDSIYKDKLIGALKVSIQYHFERDMFDNETLIIYTDRPGLVVGKAGEHYNKLVDAYTAVNSKCKKVDIYETGFMILN